MNRWIKWPFVVCGLIPWSERKGCYVAFWQLSYSLGLWTSLFAVNVAHLVMLGGAGSLVLTNTNQLTLQILTVAHASLIYITVALWLIKAPSLGAAWGKLKTGPAQLYVR